MYVLVIEETQEDMIFQVFPSYGALGVQLKPLKALCLITEALFTEEQAPAVEALVPYLINVPVAGIARVTRFYHARILLIILILVCSFAFIIEAV